MLDVIGRSQRGRICELKRGDSVLRTPYIIQSDGCACGPVRIETEGGSRILNFFGTDIPLESGLLTSMYSGISADLVCAVGCCVLRLPVTGEEVIPDDAEAVVVPNGFELKDDSRKAVDQIMKLRAVAGHNRVLCVLGLAEPSTMAIYAYMGVDVFDDTLVRALGMNSVRSLPEGRVASSGNTTVENIRNLAEECGKIATFTSAERLRELVDQRATAMPQSVALLRIFDREGFAYQEEACSTVGCRFCCNTTQSLKRPEVLRYRERISQTYERPPHKRVLLLLPCSAKKPYHTSKTHKAFASAIHTAQHDTLVHEVIVTSPLGIVPRELDVLFPANSYDIPVTGEWKCEERNFIRTMLAQLIAQGYEKIVCHLGDPELTEGLAEMENTVVGDPTTPASLSNLDAALRRATKGMEPVTDYTERREALRSVLVYQFGKDAADLLMDENTYAIGKFPYWKLIREDPANKQNKTQLGMLTPERGMVSLTMEGAAVLAAGGFYTVEMTDFEMKGNLFAVGVVSADERIRIGDEAVITLKGDVKAIGVASMSGKEMSQLKRGIAVKVRHKA